ncbi:MAG: citrate/2-methylcitrate synthase [Myxococcota bacterium]|nr:citrate/2-methylcitrate synthase [Myxococcota bacterium]
MFQDLEAINRLIVQTVTEARHESARTSIEPTFHQDVQWPVQCSIGPGLEGAIACKSKVGYVNGGQGRLVYRGYDVVDLCLKSNFEEVSYLLLHGRLPSGAEVREFKERLVQYRHVPKTLRTLVSFPIERMNPMAALRLGTNLMRQEFTFADVAKLTRSDSSAISSDEDSMAMEVPPWGDNHAIYEFPRSKGGTTKPKRAAAEAAGIESCYHLIAGVSTLAAAISRIRDGHLPIEPDPELGHTANYLYMMTGRRPTPFEERILDVALILHADHGMNASTFASMVVASTLSDIYFSVGSGIAALNGPLHGGANEDVLIMLQEIGDATAVPQWYERAKREHRKVTGFGHRVYKTYDPRARILGPLAKHLAATSPALNPMLETAMALEDAVLGDLGAEKKIYPNVDFYSGLVYECLGIPRDMFTPTFAVSRVAGWTARVTEYLENNRIFRPRAVYTGPFGLEYVPIEERE